MSSHFARMALLQPTLIFLAFATIAGTPLSFADCPKVLEDPFRLELLEARRSYIQARMAVDPSMPLSPAAYSQQVGSEFQILPVWDFQRAHVIYLASGPDVFRPVLDFPQASHFHFADCFLGWGDSPQTVIEELLRRVRALGPGGEFQILSPGFLEGAPESDGMRLRDRRLFADAIVYGKSRPDPLIARLKWVSPARGETIRFFYLHPTDFNNRRHLEAMMSHIPQTEPVLGVLQIGAFSSRFGLIHSLILKRLVSQGAYIEAGWRQPVPSLMNYLSRFSRVRRRLRRDFELKELPTRTGFDVYEPPGVFSPPDWWTAVYVFSKK